MEKRNRLAFVYLIIGAAFLFGWPYIQRAIWPPPPKPAEVKPAEAVALLGGAPIVGAVEVDALNLADADRKAKEAERKAQLPSAIGLVGGSQVTAAIDLDAPALAAAERIKAARAIGAGELIAMGRGEKPYHIQLLLNDRGASIQQAVLSDFKQADREGLAVNNPDGTPKPLHLIPGVRVPRTARIRDQRDVPVPNLIPGKITLDPEQVAHPSYVMYHYEKESDAQPVDTLGNRVWRVVSNETSSDGNTQVVAFESELGAPFYIRITKTYTLRRQDYHVGLNVSITPWERPEGVRPEPFRYQISGPVGIPIEGEWYTTTYRQGVVGWKDTRTLEDAKSIRHTDGGERHVGKENKPILFVGVMVQYFASVLAADKAEPDGPAPDFIEFVRFTPQGETHKDQEFLDDLTFRAISKKIDPTVAVTHPYVLYQGPVKVRLLKQLKGEKAVPEETVDHYRDDLRLSSLTDAPMSNWLGRFANAIFWTDLVIGFTNLIHWLLGLLSQVIPNLGICVIVITIAVRGLLHPFSRRQMINAKIMQARQAKLAPEVKKLTEKYGDDFNKLNAEKMRLYREHGINPTAMLGGCFLLLAQMPVFMGLYYALQESVFFRLEPLFPWWIPNLAAPDMLVWWSENIPWISAPGDLGGFIYLGPYLNLLPLIAVGLMLYVQTKMMPKSDDPQVQTQQKTMKFMMIFMLFFFYKSPAGLAIYFICSSLWGMVERKLIPKEIKLPEKGPSGGGPPRDRDKPEPPEGPKGWLGTKMAGWREKWQQVLEDAQKQQQLQREQPKPGGPGPRPQLPGQDRKKKKRR